MSLLSEDLKKLKQGGAAAKEVTNSWAKKSAERTAPAKVNAERRMKIETPLEKVQKIVSLSGKSATEQQRPYPETVVNQQREDLFRALLNDAKNGTKKDTPKTLEEWAQKSAVPTLPTQGKGFTVEELLPESEQPSFWKDNLRTGALGAVKGYVSTLDFLTPDSATGKSMQDMFDYYRSLGDRASEMTAKRNENYGAVGVYGGKLVQTMTQMVPDLLIAAATGGTSAATTGAKTVKSVLGSIAKNPSFWNSMAQTVGVNYDEAKSEGATDFEAFATAVIGSALSSGVEAFTGFENIPKSTNGILGWVKSALEEGGEEVVQGVIENLTAKAIYDKSAPWYSTTDTNAIVNPSKMAEEFLLGAAAGGIMGAPYAAAEAIGRRKQSALPGNETTTPAEKKKVSFDDILNMGKEKTATQNGAVNTAQAVENVPVVDVVTPKATDIALAPVVEQEAKTEAPAVVPEQKTETTPAQSNVFEFRKPISKTPVTAERRTQVDSLGQKYGRGIIWYSDNSDGADNGFYDGDGNIHINEYAENPEMVVFGHEMFHSLDEDTKNTLINFFKENANQNSSAFRAYQEDLIARYTERYAKDGRTFDPDTDFWEEFAAENIETFFADEAFINKLARENRTLLQKILNFIRDFLDIFKAPTSYTGKTSVASEAAGFSDATLRKAEKMLEKALKDVENNQVSADGVKYDVRNVNGTPVVWISDNILKQNKGQPTHQFVADYIARHIDDLYTIIESGQKVYIGEDLPGEYTQSRYTQNVLKKSPGIIKAKNRAASNIKEIIEIASNRRWEETEHKENKDAKYGMYRYSTQFGFPKRNPSGDVVGANIYKAELLIRNASNGKKYLYDIVEIEKDTDLSAWMSKMASSAAEKSADQKVGISTYSIPNSPENVKPKYSVPRDGKETSAFYENIQSAETVEDAVKQMVDDNIDLFTYEPITDEETMVKVTREVMENAREQSTRFLNLDDDRATRDDIAKGFVLMQQFQNAGDYQMAVDIAAKLRKIGTKRGQEVQIYSILKKMTPEGMLYWSQKELDQIYEELAKDKSAREVRKLRRKLTLTDEEAEFITDTMRRAEKMIDGRDKEVMLAKIRTVLQEKYKKALPKEKATARKTKAIARVGMLLNPKTTVTRNAGSNALSLPVHELGNLFSVAADKYVSNITGVRAASVGSIADLKQGAKQGAVEAWEDFRENIDTRNAAQNRYDSSKVGSDPFNIKGGNVFDSKLMQGAERTLNFLLDVGDRPFYLAYYTEVLNGLMKANGVTTPTPAMKEIAEQTALERTWQDDNGFTEYAQKLRDGLNGGLEYGLGDIIVPFIKTPANLLRATIQYSPVSVVTAITADRKALENALSKRGDSSFDQAQVEADIMKAQRKFVTDMGKGISGVLMYAVAAALAAAGVISGSEDEEDKDVRNFKKNVLGINDYSFKIGDYTFTYDWLQPVGNAMAITADITEAVKGEKTGEGTMFAVLGSLYRGLAAGGNSLFEQSFLQGLRDFFDEEDMVDAILTYIPNSVAGQITPTIFKQFAETIDPLARKSYDKNPFKKIINTVKSKVPGLTKTLEPVVDVFGREVERYGGNNNWFNVFFNPSNVSSAQKTPEAEEIWRLYQQTGNKDIFPKTAPNSFQSGGIKYQLSAKEQTEYQKEMGQKASADLTRLFASEGYKKATDEEKSDLVKKIVEGSADSAQQKILAGRDVFTSGKDKVAYKVTTAKEDYAMWDKVESSATNKLYADASASVNSFVNKAKEHNKLTDANAKEFQQYVERIESRKPDALDKELYRLRENGMGYSVTDDNPYNLFTFTKGGVEQWINVPAKDIYDVYVDAEELFRNAMKRVINTQAYKNASIKAKKDMLADAKTDVRKAIREELKAQYGYSADTDFDKAMRMK